MQVISGPTKRKKRKEEKEQKEEEEKEREEEEEEKEEEENNKEIITDARATDRSICDEVSYSNERLY